MNFHRFEEKCNMRWPWVVFTLFLQWHLHGVMATAILDRRQCNYIYNAGCYSSRNNVAGAEYKAVKRSCSVDAIIDDIQFILQFPKDASKSSVILKVNFTLPNAECKYEVALLVNSSIKNDRDCKNHVFHKTDSYEEEIHSVEKTICALPFSDRTDLNNCQKDTFSMWYEHIFTGCYALRFTIDGYKFSVLGNRFIVTDYTRTEVSEPRFRCHYEDRAVAATGEQELVRFALSVSVHADTAGMILTLSPMSHLDETKENACVRYSKRPLYTWHISTSEKTNHLGEVSKNCSLNPDNVTRTRDTECNFALRSSPEMSYCLKIELEDERCSRQTIWKPPPASTGGSKPACVWLQSCTRIIKNTSIIEYNGVTRIPDDLTSLETSILLPIVITVTIIVMVVGVTALFLCRTYIRHERASYLNSNLKDFKITRNDMEIESVESTDDEITQKSSIIADNEDKEDAEPIVFLYARGTGPFMNFVSDFRDILKTHCHCRIRDWYDAREWDEVARIGPSSWVGDLLRDEHRAIWIDTPRARKLFNARRRNILADDLGRKFSEDANPREEVISDFRDAALPIVLESAKRNVDSSGYNKHFVVRLECFDVNDEREEDPFEDLSPHTRYLIPHHLSELCSHLSSRSASVNCRESLRVDETLLRESLTIVKKKLPEFRT